MALTLWRLLRRAVDAGYRDLKQVERSKSFDALRSREEFVKLWKELKSRSD